MDVEKLKIPVAGLVGAGVGITVAEFVAEFVTRATGQVGAAKFGIKVFLKLVIGAIFFAVSGKLAGLWALGAEIAAYGSLGSIIPDAVGYIVPGGVPGLSESLAVTMRATFAKTGVVPPRQIQAGVAQVAYAYPGTE